MLTILGEGSARFMSEALSHWVYLDQPSRGGGMAVRMAGAAAVRPSVRASSIRLA